MAGTFLKAEWRKLAMANYAVDPALLRPFLPVQTELDLWQGTCYVSLVGFMFMNTRVRGFRVPFHINFEEVNLRFYVKHLQDGVWKRGVVFIKEIVPRPALAFIANTLYNEKYVTMPMAHLWKLEAGQWDVQYQWGRGLTNTFRVVADQQPTPITAGSEEEFITEHYWGYTRLNALKTAEYGVEHPRWDVYAVNDYRIDVDFSHIYGAEFGFLAQEKPVSVLLAEGSEIEVKQGNQIRVQR